MAGLVFCIGGEFPLVQFRMIEVPASAASLCDEFVLSASKL
jgi:hypothetical protein